MELRSESGGAEREGVIKFRLEHQQQQLAELIGRAELEALARPLMGWRARLYELGMIGGDDPTRYGGAGFGNLSARLPNTESFIITGTQTGHLNELSLREFALVQRVALREHRLVSRGETLPSSEALTHAVIYLLSSELRWVFHVHAPQLWQAREALGLIESPAHVAYGTQEMAEEVERLARDERLMELGVFAMGGHEDGLIAFGRDPDEVGERLLALERRCRERLSALDA
jgi:ribulose-5-phosphate 4-epimerase/fuculose-1-phosphate aldolase